MDDRTRLTLTPSALMGIMPRLSRERAAAFAAPLSAAMEAHGITTPMRQAMFLAQIAHESGELRYVRELGSNAYLAKYDTGRLAARLGNTPAADGDGQKYRGRGLIQITGHDNYAACGKGLGIDLVAHPEKLEEPEYACLSAAWFWATHNLNALADQGTDNAFLAVTKRINGGTNGLSERRVYFTRAKKALASQGGVQG